MIVQKSYQELQMMRKAGRIAAQAMRALRMAIKAGVTTEELSNIAESFILEKGGRPAFKGYRGFPASICISVNDEVVHGIPGKKVLKEGDIVGIDLGVEYEGYYGDIAATFPVGKVDAEAKRLIEVAKEALKVGISQCQVGNHLFDISAAIQEVVEKNGFSVVRQFVGHGIGKSLHEDPQVPNYGERGKGPLLESGMTFALEPMVNAGGWEVEVLSDGWTVVTADGSLSAHFEHTVAVTDKGPWILTRC
jgi:methionyl aminopeptidase